MSLEVNLIDIVDFYRQYPEEIGNVDVKTRFGYKRIEYADITAPESIVMRLELENNMVIEGSPDHRVMTDEGWIKIQNINPYSNYVLTIDGFKHIHSVSTLEFREDLYDLQVANVQEYYSNGIVSHNSTLIDAIVFALFGKSYRAVNKSTLVNTVNQKKCRVEIKFRKGQDEYVVVRGIKPGKFEIYCNDEKLEEDGAAKDYQKRLERILGFNYKAFCQTCMIGSSDYIPFMRLSAQARRQLIETLLDIGVFSDMNKMLKQQMNNWKEDVRHTNEQYKLKKVEYDSQLKHVNTLREDAKDRLEQIESDLDDLENRRGTVAERYELASQELERAKAEAIDEQIRQAREESTQIEKTIGKIDGQVKHARSMIDFFNANDHCPTCEQELTEDLTRDACARHAREGKENAERLKDYKQQKQEIDTKLQRLRARKEEITELENQTKQYKEQLLQLDEAIDDNQRLYNDAKQSLESGGRDKEAEDELNSISGELQQLSKRYQELIGYSDLYETASNLLKDTGIKASIIRYYIPILNAKVNEYLKLLNFPVRFELDEEFNETLQSRYRNEFTYSNFSMGERQRLDISLLFAWRDLAQMKNSVSTNLLVLDETLDQSMDMQGTDDLLMIVNQICKNHNVFIVSHKALLEDKLSSHIRLESRNGFTKMVQE